MFYVNGIIQCRPNCCHLHEATVDLGIMIVSKCYLFVFSAEGPRSAGWRELPDQRRRFPFDAREDERGYRRPRSGSGSLDDDSLPEWCLEDADEEAGTFDSSGAFLSLKVRGHLRINQ